MQNQAFSELTLALTASASDSDPQAHQARMVDILGALMQFDMAWWGWSCFTEGRIILAQSTLHNLPADYETSVRLVAQLDPFILHGRHLPVFAMTVDAEADSLPSAYRAFARKYDIGAMLNGHCQLERSTAYKFFMSIYRRTGRPGFSREEVDDYRLILRHLEQSLSLSLRAELRGIAGPEGEAALVDDNCQLVRATRGFASRLSREGISIARENKVIGQLVARGGSWSGKEISLEARDYGRALKLLRMSRRGVWDLLSPQERKVAEALLTGASARSIASTLGKSPNTVRNQVATIYAKLACK